MLLGCPCQLGMVLWQTSQVPPPALQHLLQSHKADYRAACKSHILPG